MRVRQVVYVILRWEHLRRTGLIALVIGTWLTLFNQGHLLMAGTVNAALAVKIVLNYMTPFVVSNAGLISRQDVEQQLG